MEAKAHNGKIVSMGGTMFEQAFKNIDDILWKDAGASSELDYTEQTSWLLFLKYMDDLIECSSGYYMPDVWER